MRTKAISAGFAVLFGLVAILVLSGIPVLAAGGDDPVLVEGSNGLEETAGDQDLQGTAHFGPSTNLGTLPLSIEGRKLDTVKFPYMLGDVNGDGKPDLVFVYSDSEGASIYVALGNGDGFDFQKTAWGSTVSLKGKADDEIGNFQLLDMNGDAKADLVYAYTTRFNELSNPTQIHVLISNGKKFGQPHDWTEGATVNVYYNFNNGHFGGFLIGDVTGDGLPDLVEMYQDVVWRDPNWMFQGNVYTRINSGSQFALRSASNQMVLPDFHFPGFIADVDGDGRGDIVWFYQEWESGVWREVRVSRSTGGSVASPAFWGHLSKPFFTGKKKGPTFALLKSHRMVDMNGDGMQDLVSDVMLNSSKGEISVLLSTGTKSSESICYAKRQFPYANPNNQRGLFNTAQFNDDGLPDLWYEAKGGKIAVWPSGKFQWPDPLPSKPLACNDESNQDEIWGKRDQGSYSNAKYAVSVDENGNGIDAIVYPKAKSGGKQWQLRGQKLPDDE